MKTKLEPVILLNFTKPSQIIQVDRALLKKLKDIRYCLDFDEIGGVSKMTSDQKITVEGILYVLWGMRRNVLKDGSLHCIRIYREDVLN